MGVAFMLVNSLKIYYTNMYSTIIARLTHDTQSKKVCLHESTENSGFLSNHLQYLFLGHCFQILKLYSDDTLKS